MSSPSEIGAPTRPSRRRFLRATLLGGALLSASWVVGRQLGGYRLPPGVPRPRVLSDKELVVLAAACARLVAPDDGAAPVADGYALADWLDDYLANLDEPLRRDLTALIHFLEHGAPLFRLSTTRFSRQSAAAQDATLAAFADSPIALRRQGLQALRSLAFLAYYRQDATWPMLGYAGPMLPRSVP